MAETGTHRRLAAILAADVAGYSRLMGRDEDGTLSAVRALRDTVLEPQVHGHGGRIFKAMGDGFMVEFASIVDAVRCAVAVQAQLAQPDAPAVAGQTLALRVGLHLGDVIAVGEDLFGDAVNVAARLEGLADPGGICLSETALQQVGTRIGLQTQDMGFQALKNIDAPVRSHRIRTAVAETRPPDASTEPAKPPDFVSPPPRPTLAILPFRSLGAAEDAYIADGISLGIQTLLVQLPNMFFVNACNNQRYRAGNATAAEALSDAPVRYAIEGTVQQAGGRVRISAQICDLQEGGILWASTYDRTLEDVFALQDEIARNIAAALSVELIGGHLAHDFTRGLQSPDAWEHFLRGINHFYRMTRSSHALAIPHFEALAAAHPESALGPCYLSSLHYYAATHEWGDVSDHLTQAEKWARQAMTLQVGNNGLGHAVLSAILLSRNGHEEALALAHEAVGYRANCPFSNVQLGVTQAYLGDRESGLRNIRTAIARRSAGPAPSDLNALAIVCRDRGDLDLSIAAAKESFQIEPDFLNGMVTLASDLALSEQAEQAGEVVSEILRLRPGFSVDAFVSRQPYLDREFPDRIAAALEQAGLPR